MVKHPSPRQQVLTILKQGGPQSASEIAGRFGAGVSAVRPHLERLIADQLVDIEIVRGGTGRPRYRYKLTELAEGEFPKSYESFAVDFFDALEKVGGEPLLEQVFSLREDALYTYFKDRMGPGDLDGSLQRICELLNEQGYMASVERDGDDFVLVARNCPVPAISDHSELPCRCERNLLARLLGAEVEEEMTGYDGGRPCTFRIHAVN